MRASELIRAYSEAEGPLLWPVPSLKWENRQDTSPSGLHRRRSVPPSHSATDQSREGRHSVARAVFFGKRGELRQRYKEGQEDQLGALGLVVNAIVLWNTRYMDAVLSKLQADGDAIADADARRLSPLVHKHLNFLGRYHFSLPGDVRGGALRELRDPNAGLEEEWLLPVGSP